MGALDILRDVVAWKQAGVRLRRPRRMGSSTLEAMARPRAKSTGARLMPKTTVGSSNTTANSGKTQRMAPTTNQGEKS